MTAMLLSLDTLSWSSAILRSPPTQSREIVACYTSDRYNLDVAI
ncbi:hypothetical protein PN499_24150 [Kamptonema animale CS-326]|nr:hypothetical protein [Kamptonema animale CS-326]